MKRRLLARLKYLLTLVGARVSIRRLHSLQMLVNYLKLGRWVRDQGFELPRRVPNRTAVFATVAEQVRDRKVLYLEFGVYKGTSIRYWSRALKNRDSRLHGFDSFQGLPEDFDSRYQAGHFDTGGRVPEIEDERVQFFKGWFDEVLPGYVAPDHDTLVMTLDADLYSSTRLVLNHFRLLIKPGAFLYFDDMSRPDHEARAFQEFMQETGLEFRMVAADYSLNTAFFECVA